MMSDQSYLAENIIEIYKRHGRAWVEKRGEFLYEKTWLERFLALLPQHTQILDLGCGSGKPIAQYLIEQRHTITGVDSSDVMLDLAQDYFPNHTWIHADMRNVELQQRFDGILAWDSFFHLTQHDQRCMFQQFSKFAKQGTALIFTTGPSHGEAIGDLFGEALYHSSLSPEEYRQLLKKYDFEEVLMISEDAECAGHTVWLAQKRTQ